MSRPIPVGPCNRRFDKDASAPEGSGNAFRQPNIEFLTEQGDATCWDAPLHENGDLAGLRTLDEASVDACFSRLDDLLSNLS